MDPQGSSYVLAELHRFRNELFENPEVRSLVQRYQALLVQNTLCHRPNYTRGKRTPANAHSLNAPAAPMDMALVINVRRQ
jgi:hypothetical protein